MARCERCDRPTLVYTVSFMNLDTICPDCQKEEQEHPRYKEAKERELQEVLRGNYNYPGLFYGQKWPFKEGKT